MCLHTPHLPSDKEINLLRDYRPTFGVVAIRDSNHGRQVLKDSDLPVTPLYLLLHKTEIGKYLRVRVDAWYMLTTKRKQHPPPGDDASTAEAAPGRFGRDEQREARRANGTPNGGPRHELGRLRLKTWSKYDLSIAET